MAEDYPQQITWCFFLGLIGIFTLLLVVPISLAVLHQGGAVVLFALAIWNMWELSPPRKTGS